MSVHELFSVLQNNCERSGLNRVEVLGTLSLLQAAICQQSIKPIPPGASQNLATPQEPIILHGARECIICHDPILKGNMCQRCQSKG